MASADKEEFRTTEGPCVSWWGVAPTFACVPWASCSVVTALGFCPSVWLTLSVTPTGHRAVSRLIVIALGMLSSSLGGAFHQSQQ